MRKAILSVARKNGKTALIAAMVLAHLVGPEAITNGEIYSAANDREQAAQVYKVAAQIVRADPELDGMLKCINSTKTITCPSNGTFYRAISAEAGTKHGFNPSLVIYDELAQSKTRELFDVLDTSMGARAEPLFVIISTQSPDAQHPLSMLIDSGLRGEYPEVVCHLYQVDDDCEDIFDPSVWKDANPALGDFRGLKDLQSLANQAKDNPIFEASFRNLYLNQRVDAVAPLVSRNVWNDCARDFQLADGEEIYLALDLSSTDDLTALVAMAARRDDDRTQAWFWKPGSLLKEHSRRDRAPYDVWEKQGFLFAPPGNAVDYEHVARFIGEINERYKVKGLAYDRWRMQLLIKELRALDIQCYIEGDDGPQEGLRLVPFGQGFKDMAPAIDAISISVAERKFAHNKNPVLTMCFANAIPVSDPAGNRKLDKSKSRLRIDGAVAAVMAKGLKSKDLFALPEVPTSPWDDPSFSLVST